MSCAVRVLVSRLSAGLGLIPGGTVVSERGNWPDFLLVVWGCVSRLFGGAVYRTSAWRLVIFFAPLVILNNLIGRMDSNFP